MDKWMMVYVIGFIIYIKGKGKYNMKSKNNRYKMGSNKLIILSFSILFFDNFDNITFSYVAKFSVNF